MNCIKSNLAFDPKIFIGQTNDIERRLSEHNDPNYKNTLYTTKLYSATGIADTFAMGHNSIMMKYMNVYSQLNKFASTHTFSPELFIYHQMKTVENINIIPIDWNYKINWHGLDLNRVWWRDDSYLGINYDKYNEYLAMKTSSYDAITQNFNNNDKKYTLTNVSSKMNMFVTDINNDSGRCIIVDPIHSTPFYVMVCDDITIRVNIKLTKNADNLNKDTSGWNVFTTPHDNIVYGRGNAGLWAQFYLIKENDSYYIIACHSVKTPNRVGTYGRYIGVIGGQLFGDLPKCNETKWFIR